MRSGLKYGGGMFSQKLGGKIRRGSFIFGYYCTFYKFFLIEGYLYHFPHLPYPPPPLVYMPGRLVAFKQQKKKAQKKRSKAWLARYFWAELFWLDAHCLIHFLNWALCAVKASSVTEISSELKTLWTEMLSKKDISIQH